MDGGLMVTNEFNIVDLINLAVAIAIILAGTLSVFYIFVGGISFILSGGQEDKIKQAVHTIRYAIIGLIVTILSVTIIKIIGYVFGFDLLSLISWEKISFLMSDLIDRIVSGSASSVGGGTLR
ncbi:hypothetical protein KJ742_04740 [Patescibacteria group bacterium]|nr:hypothetical protein [Patescibacteria group bacterium]MBU1683226.1 hypothetical protein [Patescibacteria group bacterium]MBU1935747.1 hypothetical protein [Patescibacteria group bacterium]